MSSQENKMIINAKRHEKIGTAIFVIFFASVHTEPGVLFL